MTNMRLSFRAQYELQPREQAAPIQQGPKPGMSSRKQAAAPAAAAPGGSKKRKQRPSKSVEPEDADAAPPAAVAPADGAPRLGAGAVVPYTNKQRVLVFSTRGITARYRHLMDDIRKLLPHHKKDVKVSLLSCVILLCVALPDVSGCPSAAGREGLPVGHQRNRRSQILQHVLVL
jgi:hypothetical protein